MNPYVGPDGDTRARFVWLGMHPGKQEEKEGRPFVGPSGKFMDMACGASPGRRGTWVTNVRKRRPPEQSASENERGIVEALPELAEEFGALAEARTMLTVGEDGLRAVLGLAEVSRFHGSMWNRAEIDAIRAAAEARGTPVVGVLPPKLHTLVAMYHPAFTMHGGLPQFRSMLMRTARRAAMWSARSNGPERRSQGAFDLNPAPDVVQAWLRKADEGGWPISLDVETPLDDDEKITICGLSAGGTTAVFRWAPWWRDIVAEMMQRRGVVVGHNFLFDLYALGAYGIVPGPERVCVDTIVAESLLRPSPRMKKDDRTGAAARWHALATCVMDAGDGVAYWKEAMYAHPPRNKNRWATLAMYEASYPWCPADEYDLLYCGLDAMYTLDPLWKARREELRKEQML